MGSGEKHEKHYQRQQDRKRQSDEVISSDDAPIRDAPVAQARANQSVGRNDPCPCGSGKKYKKCCGKPT